MNDVWDKIISVLKRHRATYIALFGSVVRGEATSNSDVDVLVEFSETPSLLELVGIENELSDELGTKADLLFEDTISPYVIDRVKK